MLPGVWASMCIQQAIDEIRSLPIDVEPKPPKAPAASAPKLESIYQFLIGGVQPTAQKLSATAKVYPHPKLPTPPLAPPTWSHVKADKQKDALDETWDTEGWDAGYGADASHHHSWARSCLDDVGIY